MQRAPYNFRYFIYKIENDSEIVIESTGSRDEGYGEFSSKLGKITNDCRYGLIDLDCTTKDGRSTSKLIFLLWAPDTAKVKSKMIYASSKEAIKSALVGVGIFLTSTDASELDEEHIQSSIAKFL